MKAYDGSLDPDNTHGISKDHHLKYLRIFFELGPPAYELIGYALHMPLFDIAIIIIIYY